ncbi:MAG: hypothetical protein ACXWSR_17570 [Bdellovibrionota bacterium]
MRGMPGGIPHGPPAFAKDDPLIQRAFSSQRQDVLDFVMKQLRSGGPTALKSATFRAELEKMLGNGGSDPGETEARKREKKVPAEEENSRLGEALRDQRPPISDAAHESFAGPAPAAASQNGVGTEKQSPGSVDDSPHFARPLTKSKPRVGGNPPPVLPQPPVECNLKRPSNRGIDPNFLRDVSDRLSPYDKAARKLEAKKKIYSQLDKMRAKALEKVDDMDCGQSEERPSGMDMPDPSKLAKGDRQMPGPGGPLAMPRMDGMDVSPELQEILEQGMEDIQDEVKDAMKEKMRSCMAKAKPPGDGPPSGPPSGGPGAQSPQSGLTGMTSTSGMSSFGSMGGNSRMMGQGGLSQFGGMGMNGLGGQGMSTFSGGGSSMKMFGQGTVGGMFHLSIGGGMNMGRFGGGFMPMGMSMMPLGMMRR